MLSHVKRFAFWPVLALVMMTVTSAISDPEHGSTTGTLVGLAASIPAGYLIDRRRRRFPPVDQESARTEKPFRSSLDRRRD
jgi:hypothetical protein